VIPIPTHNSSFSAVNHLLVSFVEIAPNIRVFRGKYSRARPVPAKIADPRKARPLWPRFLAGKVKILAHSTAGVRVLAGT
jgi:hypothetical protein